MNTEETTKLLKDLAFSRKMQEKGKAWIAAAQTKLQDTPEWKALEALKDEQSAYVARAEACYESLTAWAEEEYSKDQNKHPIAGVEIKMITEATITDEKAAKQWAAANAPAVLTLNMTKFKPIITKLDVDFCEVTEKAKAYIGSDLTEYLPK